MAKLMLRTLLAVGLAAALPAGPAEAQRAVNSYSPALPNSAQRRAILDALRPAVERKLGPNVEFMVQRLEVRQGWALVIADPIRRGGRRIIARQHFSAEELDRMDGITVNAVLRFRGGRWWLVDHAIGPTDVWYCGVQGPPRELTGC